MSKSGIPVLPESIARALSKACGGRAVYWTCVGTPGVSASQIVRDIDQITPHKPGRLEMLVKEWQAKRKKWQERQELRRRPTELESAGEDGKESPRSYLTEWWQFIRSKEKKTPSEVRGATEHLVKEWWRQMTNQVKEDISDIKENLTEIKEIVKSRPEKLEEEELKAKTDEEALIHRGGIFRRDSVDPKVVLQYDIAVVLTGLNDIKEAFMPHMTRGAESSVFEGTERVNGGLRNQLHDVLYALEDKMGEMDLETDHSTTELSNPSTGETPELNLSPELKSQQPLQRPLIVVPELPVAPLQVFRLAPLCWFLVPLFRAMENNKKFLGSCFPEYVIFVPQPNLKWWDDVEAGYGPIRENLRQERLLLHRTDIAQHAKERIQELMKRHYNPDKEDKDGYQEQATQHRDGDKQNSHNHHHLLPENSDLQKASKKKGSAYVAVDKMHPNDEGYELWGRHIAAAIVEHWNK